MGEHRAGLEKGTAKADPAEIGGRLPGHTERARVRELEEVKSDDRGVLVRRGSGEGMGAKEWCRNTGSPRKQSIKAQRGIPRGTGLACGGGGEARRSEEARNERRAKEPQFQGNATSGARVEIGASLPPAEKLWKLEETLHAQAKGVTTRGRKYENTLVRKPDAGNPHVRFDERGSGNGSAKGYRATPRLYQTPRTGSRRKIPHYAAQLLANREKRAIQQKDTEDIERFKKISSYSPAAFTY